LATAKPGTRPGMGATERFRPRRRSEYKVEREGVAGVPRFVVVSPAGNRLYWFSDLPSAEAEAEELSRDSVPSG